MTTLNDLNGYLDDEAYTVRVGELRALLSASIADTAKHKLVPTTPTLEMQYAAIDTGCCTRPTDAYAAMLAAAPEVIADTAPKAHAIDCEYIQDDNPWARCTCGVGGPNDGRKSIADTAGAKPNQEVVGWVSPNDLLNVQEYGYAVVRISKHGDGVVYVPLVRGSK